MFPPLIFAMPQLRSHLGQAIRTALSAGLCYWLTTLLRLPGGYWAAISAIVVMQSQAGTTLLVSRARIVGTMIGAFAGWLTVLVWHHSLLIYAIAVFMVVLVCLATNMENAARLGGVTISIIVLIPHAEPAWQIALIRFIEVSFGICVSLVIAYGWSAAAERVAARNP